MKQKVEILDYRLLKLLIRKYLSARFNIDDSNHFCKDYEPPCLMISNHITNYDPFIIAAYTKYPLHFVASDRQFIHPVKGFFLRRYGALPKTKFRNDYHAIKDIQRIIHDGGAVGLFPEGRRNWDGRTGELVFSTSKLIKLLNIDVIGVTIKGGYLSQPRWALNSRKGKVFLSSRVLIKKDSLQNMSYEDIYKVISRGIMHDEYKFQSNKMIRYKGKNLAEKLELGLFICPVCKDIDSLRSKGNIFKCMSCEATWEYDEFGFLQSRFKYFSDIKEWNQWQIGVLKDYLRKDAVIQAESVRVFSSSRLKPFTREGEGSIKIRGNVFLFDSLQSPLTIHISDIDGINVQSNDMLEFYNGKKLYRAVFLDGYSSAYKWALSLNMIKSNFG